MIDLIIAVVSFCSGIGVTLWYQGPVSRWVIDQNQQEIVQRDTEHWEHRLQRKKDE